MGDRVVVVWFDDWFQDADAEKVLPQVIDRGPREVGILGRSHPVGEDHAGLHAGLPLGLDAVDELGLGGLVRFGDGDLARVGVEALATARLDAGEEGRVFPELVLGPLGERVLMALGTGELDAEEDARGVAG
jgi:hypothetical protein